MGDIDLKPRRKTKFQKNPWDAQIDVHLTKGCPNPEFDIYSNLPTQGKKVIFKNNHRPGFNITFTLYDETGENYLFPLPADFMEACWSQAGTTCPTEPVWDIFEPISVSPDRKSLVVYNDNPSPPIGDFYYVLRVTKDDDASYCNLDPIGGDQNGPRV